MSECKNYLLDWLYDLSEASGYSFDDLLDQWNQYVDECQEDGEEINWDYFCRVSMEQDW